MQNKYCISVAPQAIFHRLFPLSPLDATMGNKSLPAVYIPKVHLSLLFINRSSARDVQGSYWATEHAGVRRSGPRKPDATRADTSNPLNPDCAPPKKKDMTCCSSRLKADVCSCALILAQEWRATMLTIWIAHPCPGVGFK